jgi:hypothetical protein
VVCFRCRLAEFEAEFDANPLLLHISHFGRSERSQNSTTTTLKKCTEKEHSSTQHNATWQTGSQRVQLATPRGLQLYYKRFSRGIQISGTFGLHHVIMHPALSGDMELSQNTHYVTSNCPHIRLRRPRRRPTLFQEELSIFCTAENRESRHTSFSKYVLVTGVIKMQSMLV